MKTKKSAKSKVIEPFEWQALTPQPVIGVDEVGRGCLAGRVYAAAVILEPGDYPYADSKTLSESRREELSDYIKRHHQYGIGHASVEEIEEINILHAALLAMKRAILSLQKKTGFQSAHVLVDGKFPVPGLDDSFEQTCLVKGDLRAAPVAAASILAKVARDHYISDLGETYPQYGFATHKGYSTPAHKAAIAEHGPSEHHRRLFAGVKEHL